MEENSNQELLQEFIEQALYRMGESSRMLHICLESIDASQLWLRPNQASNSIGNLILHLCGNIRQYAIASLGNRPDTRNRDAEFSAREGHSLKELLEMLRNTIEEATAVIRATTAEEMLRVRKVQAFELSGLGIVLHVVEHYSYHTGQIAFWTKILNERGLDFYAGTDLNLIND